MSTLKSVGQKLFKTELATQRVELGVAEDIAKMASDASSILKVLNDDKITLANADKAIANAMTAADKVSAASEKNSQKAGALLPKIGNILDKADKAAKDLGLDSKGITGYNELDKLYFAIEAAQKEVGLNYVFKN
jgi:hypothetical protein